MFKSEVGLKDPLSRSESLITVSMEGGVRDGERERGRGGEMGERGYRGKEGHGFSPHASQGVWIFTASHSSQ